MATGNLDPTSLDQSAHDTTRARDRSGRWVRRPAAAGEGAPQEFVFDDRIIEGMLPPTAAARLLNPEGTAPADGGDFSWKTAGEPLAPAVAPEEITAPVSEAVAPAAWDFRRAFSRLPTRALLAGGGVLALLGILFFVFPHDFFDGKRAELAPPPPTIVAPVVVPAVPRQVVRRPAARPVAAKPAAAPSPPRRVRETAHAAAPVVIPPAPKAPAARAVVVAPLQPPSAGAAAAPPAAAAPSTPDEEGWFNLAEEYLQMGDENRAESVYRRVLNDGTQKGRAALALGDLMARKNDFARAQEFYRASKRLFQDSAQPSSRP